MSRSYAHPALCASSLGPRPALGRGLVLNRGVNLPFPALPGDRQICNHHFDLILILNSCLGSEDGRIRSFRIVLKECRQRGPMEMSSVSEDYI